MSKVKKIEKVSPAKVNIRPLMGYCLVEPSEAENRTASGIILPESAQEKPSQGTILSTGDPIIINGKEILPPVKVGDKVIYKKWGADEIKLMGKEYRLVKFEDLLAVIEG